jgi:HAD superfamily hydrolase (TIGR01484 family)
MEITNTTEISSKDLIVFDLDGTLARTKAPMDAEMTQLMKDLLAAKKVAVIGGGKYELFQQQLLEPLTGSENLLQNLFLFPATSTSFYRYENGWQKIYSIELPPEDREKIKRTFEEVFRDIGYTHPEKTYGEVIEDRITQVTFSALGQDIVKALGDEGIRLKDEWKEKNTTVKMQIATMMQERLPHLEVRAAGHTSVDITKKGIDKAYGLQQIEEQLGFTIAQMLFIGDAIFPGGNDYAAVGTGVDYIPVKDPEETKTVIRNILK